MATCSTTAHRRGGDSNDAVLGTLPGGLVYGTTRSRDGGFACPGALNADVPWVAPWSSGLPEPGLAAPRCLTGAGRVTRAFLAGNAIWLYGLGGSAIGDLADAGVIGTSGGAIDGYAVALDAEALDAPSVRRLVFVDESPAAVAARADGCLVVGTRISPTSQYLLKAIPP